MKTFTMTLKHKGSRKTATSAEFTENELDEIVGVCDEYGCETAVGLRDFINTQYRMTREVYVEFQADLYVTTQEELRAEIIRRVNAGEFDSDQLS